MTGPSERVRQIQEEIARWAARPEEDHEETLAVLTFTLAEERYALPLKQVREVSRSGSITPIPGLPPAVMGATGLRGEVLAVLDLAQLLGLEQLPLSPESRLVIARHEGGAVALVIDRVEDIDVLPRSMLRPPPSASEGRPAFLQGIFGQGEGIIRLLDLARLLESVYHGA